MIAAIVLGAMHLDSCPVQPNIPIYLVVLGLSGLLSQSLSQVYFCSLNRNSRALTLVLICAAILHLFIFCWVVVGTYWVYCAQFLNNWSGTAQPCAKAMYRFAYSVTASIWLFLSLVLFCGGYFLLLNCYKIASQMAFENNLTYDDISEFPPQSAGEV